VEFEIKEGFVHKRYLLYCPMGREIKVELKPGRYSIRDMRLYY
jgi:hypothetical protein